MKYQIMSKKIRIHTDFASDFFKKNLPPSSLLKIPFLACALLFTPLFPLFFPSPQKCLLSPPLFSSSTVLTPCALST